MAAARYSGPPPPVSYFIYEKNYTEYVHVSSSVSDYRRVLPACREIQRTETFVCRRCCSLESPKKLRFAMHHEDGTPVRRRPSGVAEEDEYSCCDRHLSVSCPCIDHFDQAPSAEQPPVATSAAVAPDKQHRGCNGLQAPVRTHTGFPRVNSAPVTPMAADCIDMTAVSSLQSSAMTDDDVNEPLIRAADYGGESITFV